MTVRKSEAAANRPADSCRPHYKVALFDFDGTLSLIRTGWQQIMLPMMVEVLLECPRCEDPETIRGIAETAMWRLTGKETIYQMEALAQLVRERGREPLAPRAYKREYLRRLSHAIAGRVEALKSGGSAPDNYLVPGAHAFLCSLYRYGVRLYLASGTDQEDVSEEAGLLNIARYFEGRIFGAREDRSSSKAALVRRILDSSECKPDELIVFGDGYVEIEEVKKSGGFAVGMATSEPECLHIDAWKRDRLQDAGADRIVPNFLCHDSLMALVCGGQ